MYSVQDAYGIFYLQFYPGNWGRNNRTPGMKGTENEDSGQAKQHYKLRTVSYIFKSYVKMQHEPQVVTFRKAEF